MTEANSAANSTSAPELTEANLPALTPRQRAWARFKSNRAALVSFWLLAALLLFVVVYPWASQYGPEQISDDQFQRPGAAHWLGTDVHGRDLLVRLCYGAQISFVVGIVGALVCLVIGVLWGSIAGWKGGRIDSAMMRVVDVLYSMPPILLAIILMATWEPWLRKGLSAVGVGEIGKLARLLVLFLALGAVSWLTMARIVRGQVLSLRSRPFVEASRVMGGGLAHILRWHII